jgi:uncharacterized DUF497 family protein
MDLEFEWDAAKAQANLLKHGVSLEEASTAFADPLSMTIPDPDHSLPVERRWLLLGRSSAGRLLVVAHTERGDSIRLISARTATRKERKTHEEDTP